ncbi:hypothetical protein RG47T_1694 [Mucilaginibacter polytrichastri]|uniref:histidine kinase n=2 Tax=Mucilaginibacter polytrichastri TaxID=1302689 RepID=A0A1Q5ZWV9_9SPHI|nr:hypothetical protein RG47T_1694 [Mucilaginibacter polytrichastri]SFT16254.1 PAS domain S-box-containing protein [Mucilaginibacter polytrichastri]
MWQTQVNLSSVTEPSHTPVFKKDGSLHYIIQIALNVTEKVRAGDAFTQQVTINEEQAESNKILIRSNDKLNITQKELEATINQLELSQRRFQSLVREANIGIIVLMGPEMKVEIVNKTYGQLIGRTVEELLGLQLFDIIPEAESTFRPLLEDVRVNKETRNYFDTPYTVYNGDKKIEGYLNLVYQPYIEEDQHITGVIVVCQDVTEQVRSRTNLQSAYEQLRLAKDAAQLGFFDVDIVKGTLEWDGRCRELFGISHNDVVTYEKDFVTGLHPDDRERILAIIDDVYIKAVNNGIYDVDYRTVGAEDQQIRWIRAKGQAYFDAEDRPIRFIGSVIDITEQKLDEIRKNDFIGMVSHELKTPLTSLTAIIQVANLKMQKSDDAFIAGAMEKATVQVKRMSNMINGFLNVSRLESAKLSIDKQPFDMNELIKEMIHDTNLTVSGYRIDYEDCNPVLINADRDKIGSVITNLVSNAIKYSPKADQVEIKCHVKENQFQVSIRDYGMGLTEGDKDKVFERYFRVEGNNNKHIAGFGIGLYLSAEIIQRHHGKIWVESELGKGSTFFFSIPI